MFTVKRIFLIYHNLTQQIFFTINVPPRYVDLKIPSLNFIFQVVIYTYNLELIGVGQVNIRK